MHNLSGDADADTDPSVASPMRLWQRRGAGSPAQVTQSRRRAPADPALVLRAMAAELDPDEAGADDDRTGLAQATDAAARAATAAGPVEETEARIALAIADYERRLAVQHERVVATLRAEHRDALARTLQPAVADSYRALREQHARTLAALTAMHDTSLAAVTRQLAASRAECDELRRRLDLALTTRVPTTPAASAAPAAPPIATPAAAPTCERPRPRPR